jgi:uncharacterized membrane protein YeaQ/YmgE (transglycosylase-associated protein family)
VGLVAWIALGLVAGVIARLVVPGRQNIGCVATLAVGVVGALVGGFVAEAVFDEQVDFAFDLKSLAIATAFAIVLLFALQAIGGRRRW